MNILVVSGFLGAGKTTFIKALAAHTGKDFVILENEYGDVGIDGDRLRTQSRGDVNIWELTEGCICCSMKGECAASVLTIANTVDPEYLVIEPTGVGLLSQIIANLQRIEYEKISLLAPITIVDGQNLWRSLREYPVICEDQLRCARTIFVSKLEQSAPEEQARIREALRARAPESTIHTDPYEHMERDAWLALLKAKYDGTMMEDPPKDLGVLPDSFSLSGITMEGPEGLILLLEHLVHGAYGQVVRAKGCVAAGGECLCFDLAGGEYCITGEVGAAGGEVGKAVFIGTDIERERIRRFFS